MDDEVEYTAAEQAEIDDANALAADIKWLMSNDQFKRVILDRYINQTSLTIGSNFSGQQAEIEALKAVSGLNYFLETNK